MPTDTKPFLPKPDPQANGTRLDGESARLALGASPQRWRHYTHNKHIDADVFGRVGVGDLVALTTRLAVEFEARRHATPGRPPDELRSQLLASQIQTAGARAELDRTRTAQANLDLLESRGLVLAAAGVESGVTFVMHVVAGLLRRLPRELARRVPGGTTARAAFIKAATARLTALTDEVADRLAKVAAPESTDPLRVRPPADDQPSDHWTAGWSLVCTHIHRRADVRQRACGQQLARAERALTAATSAAAAANAAAAKAKRREQRATKKKRAKKKRQRHAGRRAR